MVDGDLQSIVQLQARSPVVKSGKAAVPAALLGADDECVYRQGDSCCKFAPGGCNAQNVCWGLPSNARDLHYVTLRPSTLSTSPRVSTTPTIPMPPGLFPRDHSQTDAMTRGSPGPLTTRQPPRLHPQVSIQSLHSNSRPDMRSAIATDFALCTRSSANSPIFYSTSDAHPVPLRMP